MNLKKAKALRKTLRKAGIDLSEPRKYLVKMTGSKKTKKTIFNDPDSPRGMYQAIKRRGFDGKIDHSARESDYNFRPETHTNPRET